MLRRLKCLSTSDVKQTVQNDGGQARDNRHFAANSNPHIDDVHASSTYSRNDFGCISFYLTKHPLNFLIAL